MSPGNREAPRLDAEAGAARRCCAKLPRPTTPRAPAGLQAGRIGCVLGFGDILAGDRALGCCCVIDAAPGRVRFHVVETLAETGFGMSRKMARSARSAALRILGGLEEAGLAPGRAGSPARLFYSTVLGQAF